MEKVYDVAIVGTGPAGLSAALNFKLHGKNTVWFGSKDLSDKVDKSEKIANYPGFTRITGKDLNDSFKRQIHEEDLEITEKMVTNIASNEGKYMLLANNDLYEAKSVLLATGAVSAKGFEGEDELLGRGVSYCATCDGFLYKDKILAVFCGSKKYEHEVEYLAEIAEKIYLFTPYKDSEIKLHNVEQLSSPMKTITGGLRADGIVLADGTNISVDGIFILRTAVSPTTLLRGLEMDGPHIVVDKHCRTSMEGVFAAGDCTGRPYQITTAMGEGNTAALGILEYLADLEKKKKEN